MKGEDYREIQRRFPVVSVIIPAYNEHRRIGPTLERLADFSRRNKWTLEVVVVDDGSRDGTADVVRTGNWEPLSVRLLSHLRNEGKGASVRTGMLAAAGDVFVMADADLPVSIDQLTRLLTWLDRGFDVVIGSRYLPDSRIVPPRPFGRRALAFCFRILQRRLLLPEIRDTQCGFKCFLPDPALDLFKRQTIASWTFDCEVLGLAQRLDYRIKEIDVRWDDDRESRLRPWREVPRAIWDLCRIRRRLNRIPDRHGNPQERSGSGHGPLAR